jgi:uncharacterized protein YjbJ (UPF0337 family)
MGVAEHGVKNQVKGAGKEVEGKANEVAGAVKGDLGQELKGKVEKNVGKAQEAFGRGETRTAVETDRAVEGNRAEDRELEHAHSSTGRRDLDK